MTPDHDGGRDLSFEHVFEPGEPDAAYTGLLLHGTGATQHDLLPLGRQLAPDEPLLSPLGKVRESGMPRWFARIEEGVFDEEDLRKRAEQLAGFLDEAAHAYDLDPPPFVAIGFSNGANIAAALLLLHPGALRGAVLLRAMVPLVPDQLPDLGGVPVYIASGRLDPLVPREEADRLASMLEDAGADVTHRYSEAQHQLEPSELQAVREWLADHEDTFRKARGQPS